MNDRSMTPGDDPGEPDPTVTFALRAMLPPEHGDAFWDRLEASIRTEPVAPTVAVPVVAADPPPLPPPPPIADVVPGPAPRRSRPPGPWIAAVAAVLLVLVAAGALVQTTSTDVKTTAATVPVEPPTSAAPTTLPPPAPALRAPSSTTAKAAPPTSAAPRTTTTSKPVSLTLSPGGLGPLRLGMTTQQARATGAAGAYSEPLGPGCGFAGPAGPYRKPDFEALFLENELVRFYVGDASRLRTPQGIGVGSPVSSLSAVPGTRIESPHPYSDPSDPSPMINVEITTEPFLSGPLNTLAVVASAKPANGTGLLIASRSSAVASFGPASLASWTRPRGAT